MALGRLACEIFFKSLSNKLRLDVLRVLIGGEKNVTGIVAALREPQSHVSHCLRRLEAAGLVGVRKKSRFRYYFLATPALEPILRLADLHFLDSGAAHAQESVPEENPRRRHPSIRLRKRAITRKGADAPASISARPA